MVTAEKQAQANLIRRREETAATRSLLNTARLIEENPLVVRLKELEALERLCGPSDGLDGRGGLRVPLRFFVEIHRPLPPRNRVLPKSQMRRHVRASFEDLIDVTWKDSRSQVRKLKARCLDLSAEGARLETDAPIPVRASIAMQSARFGSLGTASVRHCARRALKYSIGVEFTSSLTLAGPGRKRCIAEIHSAQDRP